MLSSVQKKKRGKQDFIMQLYVNHIEEHMNREKQHQKAPKLIKAKDTKASTCIVAWKWSHRFRTAGSPAPNAAANGSCCEPHAESASPKDAQSRFAIADAACFCSTEGGN